MTGSNRRKKKLVLSVPAIDPYSSTTNFYKNIPWK